jgi:type I restriction enzyme, R subunit
MGSTLHWAKRLSDREYLKRIRETLDELRGKSNSELSDKLKGRDEAQAYYGLLLEPMASYDVPKISTEMFVADIALRIEDIIKNHKIRDWTHSQDVKNHIINDMKTIFTA